MELIITIVHIVFSILLVPNEVCHGNPDAKRLYDDLLRRGGYNKLVRPVERYTDVLYVRLGLKLSQLIDVDEKNQLMTTNVWLTQEWTDENLKWTPSEYGEVDILYVPSDEIWLPDVVLFNNADGNYEVTLMTKASVRSDGRVLWEPPAVYKSSCTMDVEFFPFDEQLCSLKFGSWTYDATQVEIIHILQMDSHLPISKKMERNFTNPSRSFNSSEVEVHDGMVVITNGIDIADFYESVEWDLLAVPAFKRILTDDKDNCCRSDDNVGDGNDGGDVQSKMKKNVRDNCSMCCDDGCSVERRQFRPEITFNVTIRRKTLFHTVNLILPCVAISLLTVIVFHLPSDSGEKVALSISILLSLTVFFLLLAEIIPPTSLVVPLIGKFLIFTMLLVTLSIFVTVLVLNVHFRVPSLKLVEMGPKTKYIFLQLLPRVLRVDVGQCFRKKKPFLPYNLSRCLNHQTSAHECTSALHVRVSIEPMLSSPASVSHQTLTRMVPAREQNLLDPMTFDANEGRKTKVITHQNNFVRKGQNWEGGILSREELRDALKIKLLQLAIERSNLELKERNNSQKIESPPVHNTSQADRTHFTPLRPQQPIINSESGSFQKQNIREDHHQQQQQLSSSPGSRHQSLCSPGSRNQSLCSPGNHPELMKAFEGVHIIAEHLRREKEIKTILQEWKFVAMMLDRLFFWLFTAACVCGGIIILLQAPSIYDARTPLTQSNT